MKRGLVTVIFLVGWASLAGAQEMRGRLTGEECARTLRVGECFLEQAYPMVLFTEEEGEFYRLDLDGLDLVELDKAFGREVRVEGELVGDRLKVRQLELLEPVEKQEFFKGCL